MVKESVMKYLLMIYVNPEIMEGLSEDDRNAIFAEHDGFMKLVTESGEFISTHALGDPSASATVRVRGGVPAVTDGPYIEAKEFLAGYYLVECETRERAIELAAMLPDARYTAMEVRPIVFSAGAES
jgi:hypothetical protein